MSEQKYRNIKIT